MFGKILERFFGVFTVLRVISVLQHFAMFHFTITIVVGFILVRFLGTTVFASLVSCEVFFRVWPLAVDLVCEFLKRFFRAFGVLRVWTVREFLFIASILELVSELEF